MKFQFVVKARPMQTSGVACYLLSKHAFHINWDKSSRMNINCSSRDIPNETAVGDPLRKPLWCDGRNLHIC